MDLEAIKSLYADDMTKTQATYTHWYGYTQRLKNYVFIASVVDSVGTLLTAATLEGTTRVPRRGSVAMREPTRCAATLASRGRIRYCCEFRTTAKSPPHSASFTEEGAI